jgi:hypothetical protein
LSAASMLAALILGLKRHGQELINEGREVCF